MQHYRCKYGNCESWGSDGPFPCDRCSKCGSDLAPAPFLHEDPKPHEFIQEMVETDEGPKPLSMCKWCYRTKRQIEKEENNGKEE